MRKGFDSQAISYKHIAMFSDQDYAASLGRTGVLAMLCSF